MLKFVSPENRCRDLNTVSNVQIEPVAGVDFIDPTQPLSGSDSLTACCGHCSGSLSTLLHSQMISCHSVLKGTEASNALVQKCHCRYHHHIVDIINTIIITLIVNVLKTLNFCWWVVAHWWPTTDGWSSLWFKSECTLLEVQS